MSAIQVDTTRLPLLLHDLRLPAIARLWPEEGWPAARFLSALAELEIAERGGRRTERNLAEAHLLPGKTLDNLDFSIVPMLSKARVMALAAGYSDSEGSNVRQRLLGSNSQCNLSTDQSSNSLDADLPSALRSIRADG
jgi:DNA replication protein DnaC